ncbi:Hypothetical protein SRAE_X000153200 [Strongyloides ratti]|uniref:Uncharacterized protein n=1 Tax=Strongyloides ratti TaxID=34506 RepID=A0A090KX37_STRRB|nr:Hypothetical protein SRAE_X000153200 [Strongyloides ratti]CEF59787.1 Hypothetical protein SRAE_X000153200 [Strongyloides ratti]
MYRSKSLNYHYITNNFIDGKTFKDKINEINPYSSVSILNNQKFYENQNFKRCINSKYNLQLKLIPRIKLSVNSKTFSEKSKTYLDELITKERYNNEIQENIKNITNNQINNDIIFKEFKEKVKFRDKKFVNLPKINFTTSIDMQNSINLNSKNISQKKRHSVSQIINYFNECGDKSLNSMQNKKNINIKSYEKKNESFDYNKNINYTNSIKKEKKKYNLAKLVLGAPKFTKNNNNFCNIRTKKDILPDNYDHSIIIKNINRKLDKDGINIDEHIYEKVPDDFISNDNIYINNDVPNKPFIRTFSIFPPDLTFKPRSFKSFFYKNTIY